METIDDIIGEELIKYLEEVDAKHIVNVRLTYSEAMSILKLIDHAKILEKKLDEIIKVIQY